MYLVTFVLAVKLFMFRFSVKKNKQTKGISLFGVYVSFDKGQSTFPKSQTK